MFCLITPLFFGCSITGGAVPHASAVRVTPPERPPIVITFEDNTRRLDVTPPQRLDVVMHGSTIDGRAWNVRCDQMGGEPIWWPTDQDGADQYICEGVDY